MCASISLGSQNFTPQYITDSIEFKMEVSNPSLVKSIHNIKVSIAGMWNFDMNYQSIYDFEAQRELNIWKGRSYNGAILLCFFWSTDDHRMIF